MEFNHINDCWNYLKEATDYDDLYNRIEELPAWSGDWTIKRGKNNTCLVINDIYDKGTDSYDTDKEELDIPYDNV